PTPGVRRRCAGPGPAVLRLGAGGRPAQQPVPAPGATTGSGLSLRHDRGRSDRSAAGRPVVTVAGTRRAPGGRPLVGRGSPQPRPAARARRPLWRLVTRSWRRENLLEEGPLASGLLPTAG